MNSGAATTLAHQPFHFAVFSQNMSALFSGSIFSRSQICSFFPEPWINLPPELRSCNICFPGLIFDGMTMKSSFTILCEHLLWRSAPFPSGRFENLRRSAAVGGACQPAPSVSLLCCVRCSEIHFCALQCPRRMSSVQMYIALHCICYKSAVWCEERGISVSRSWRPYPACLHKTTHYLLLLLPKTIWHWNQH